MNYCASANSSNLEVPLTEISYIADYCIDELWFNRSLTRFAIVPDSDEMSPKAAAAALETLVKAFLKAGKSKSDSDTRNEILAELYDLHARGLILWPLGTTFHQSVLGNLACRRLFNFAMREDPTACEIRDEIERSVAFKQVSEAFHSATALSFDFWQIFITLRLASEISSVRTLNDISETHLFGLVDVLHADESWAPWLPKRVPTYLRKFRDYLSADRSDPNFALGFSNRKRARTIAAKEFTLNIRAPHLSWVVSAFDAWMDSRTSLTQKGVKSAKSLLVDFLRLQPADRCRPETAFTRPSVKSLLHYCATWGTPLSRALAVSKVREFAEWYYLDFVADQHSADSFSITLSDIERFLKSNPSPQSKRADVSARPMPTRLQRKVLEIISENDFSWPKSLVDRVTGIPSNWISWTNPKTDKVESVFCEVLPRMLMLQLELPLRNIQIRRLDSGEGDDQDYDPIHRAWEYGSGGNSGYWRDNNAKNTRRGFLREIPTSTGAIAGFWVNSNKTKDAENFFDETSGYEMPWQHDDVIKNVLSMRAWQEKYNPVQSPLPHAEIPRHVFGDEPSRAVRAVLPGRFYMFRYPLNTWERGREAPPSYAVFTNFFYDALEELEKRLLADDPESAVKIITERDAAGRPRRAIFTPHGTRSSILTALYNGGVSIGILSKLVAGHATFIMTLRYTKFDPAHVSEILRDARTKSMVDSRRQFTNFLKSATTEQAMRMTARLSDDGLIQAKTSYGDPITWSEQEIGICPNGATLCHIGGEPIRKGKSQPIHSPVPGRPRNCVRCRFFFTGYGYLLPLYMQALEGFAHIDTISSKIRNLEAELQLAKNERLAQDGAITEALRTRIRMIEESYFRECDLRDNVVVDTEARMIYVEKLRVIGELHTASDGPTIPMLVSDESALNIGIRESTRFELLDAIAQVSPFYPTIASPELEAERNGFVDRALWHSGYTPITLSPLPPDERRKAANAFAEIMLVRLGALEAENVFAGRKTISELGLQEALESAIRTAIGRPFKLRELSRLQSSAIDAIGEEQSTSSDLPLRKTPRLKSTKINSEVHAGSNKMGANSKSTTREKKADQAKRRQGAPDDQK